MRVAILSPTDFSLFARTLAHTVVQEPGLELCAVVARRVLDRSRMISEVRRDGWRLARKVWRKAVLGGQQDASTALLANLAKSRGVPDGGLRDFCSTRGIPFVEAGDLNEDASIQLLRESKPDVIAFTGGGIVRPAILDCAPHGVINTHMGILPRYRGMDVVEWAILEDRPDLAGITVHRMDAGIDTGPIHSHHPVPPRLGETIAELRARMEVVMVESMESTLRALRDGNSPPRTQAPADGRQYFVMHPRLQAQVKRKRAAGA